MGHTVNYRKSGTGNIVAHEVTGFQKPQGHSCLVRKKMVAVPGKGRRDQDSPRRMFQLWLGRLPGLTIEFEQ